MNKKYDWLIVGAGLAGSVFAYKMKQAGKKCLVIDRRKTIAGNCYTETRDGIPIHVWGAHIFHTDSDKVWDFISQFAEFKPYKHKVKCLYDNKEYTFPINLETLNQIDSSIKTEEQALEYFSQFKDLTYDPKYGDLTIDNLETHCIKQIGPRLYEIFIKDYTEKQWGKPASELPSRIIKRIPVRTNLDDTYFHNAKYQAIPKNGYTEIFDNLLKDIDVQLNVDYLKDIQAWDLKADRVLYTGALDEYFNWDDGELEWRSLAFDHLKIDVEYYQSCSVVNYSQEKPYYTRVIEHKHFVAAKSEITWITKEYPRAWYKGTEAYYPIADQENLELHKFYKRRFDLTNKLTLGRLADYKYYDMDQVIGSALTLAEKIINNK